MKACTLIQPYASLAVLGEKENETRGNNMFKTHRGPLAISASKHTPVEYRGLRKAEPFRSALARPEILEHFDRPYRHLCYGHNEDLPTAAVLGVVLVVDSQPVDDTLLPESDPRHLFLTDRERAFGDYRTGLGRYATTLMHAHPLPYPVPVVGGLGLWEWRPTDNAVLEWLFLWHSWLDAWQRLGPVQEAATAFGHFRAFDLALRRSNAANTGGRP